MAEKSGNTKIMVVEDNDINMDLLLAILEPLNFEILTASDGYDAINIIWNNADVSLILLDIGLPGIDGIEVFKRVRNNDATKDIPIIAVTAHAMAGNKEHLLSLGFNGFIEKPINKSALYEKINELL